MRSQRQGRWERFRTWSGSIDHRASLSALVEEFLAHKTSVGERLLAIEAELTRLKEEVAQPQDRDSKA